LNLGLVFGVLQLSLGPLPKPSFLLFWSSISGLRVTSRLQPPRQVGPPVSDSWFASFTDRSQALIEMHLKKTATPPGKVQPQLMILILLALFGLYCTYRLCSRMSLSNEHQQAPVDYQSLQYQGQQHPNRTQRLYCETCYTSKDIDSNGWCHRCERKDPMQGWETDFIDYVLNSEPAAGYY
jgi:hypothetical protein